MVEVNFLYCSITFTQLYIPLIIGLKKRDIIVNLFCRNNRKAYADPMIRQNKWETIFSQFNVNILPLQELNNHPGIIICVDGDIYGPKEQNVKESMLNNINRNNNLIVSLIENLNFVWCYSKYANLIDYLILPSMSYSQTYQLTKTNNLYLGSPKYDINFNQDKIYEKYRLTKTEKYVIIFYPRMERGINKYGKKFPELFYDLIPWLHDLGYKIIIKNRDKIKPSRPTTRTDPKYHEDHYFSDLTLFPSTSLELLQIVDLAIFFGSSVIEEIVMYKVPFIEFTFDTVDRFQFLRHPSYQYLISNKFPRESEFKKGIKKLEENKPNYQFDKTIKNHLFNKNGCVQQMIDQLINLHQLKIMPTSINEKN